MLSGLFGFAGMVINFAVYQQKSGKSLLVLKLVSDILWMLHYYLLGAYTGACIALIGAFRELTFIKVDKKSNWGIISLCVFCVLSVISSVVTWKSMFSVLPAVASILSVVSFYISKPHTSRVLSLPISACMFTYSSVSGSYVGMANEVITVASSVLALIRTSDAKEK
jgi:hypothetical protein